MGKFSFFGAAIHCNLQTPVLQKIKREVESIKNTKYNFVLVNKYVDGSHNMGFHADDEDEIDQSVPICSGTISLNRG